MDKLYNAMYHQATFTHALTHTKEFLFCLLVIFFCVCVLFRKNEFEKKPSSAPEFDTSNNGATANLFDRSFVPWAWVLVNIDPPIDGTVGTRSG